MLHLKINRELHYLWRAFDHEGEVLEVVATERRDRNAALRLLKSLMNKYGAPRAIVTDKLLLWNGIEDDRQRCMPRMRRPLEQPSG
jgi:transposase-like protein